MRVLLKLISSIVSYGQLSEGLVMSIRKTEVYAVRCDLNHSKLCQYATAYDSENENSARYYAHDIGWIFNKETKQDVCPACQGDK